MEFELLMFLLFKIRDSGDQVISEQGLKIKTNLVIKQCNLSIPPSPAKGKQITSSDAKKT